MAGHALIVDLFGLILMICGFCMAFRQAFVRRLFGWSPAPDSNGAQDPTAYGLRIAGSMIMAFGLALGVIVTLASLA